MLLALVVNTYFMYIHMHMYDLYSEKWKWFHFFSLSFIDKLNVNHFGFIDYISLMCKHAFIILLMWVSSGDDIRDAFQTSFNTFCQIS